MDNSLLNSSIAIYLSLDKIAMNLPFFLLAKKIDGIRLCLIIFIWCYFGTSRIRPPDCRLVFVDAAVHDSDIGETPPAV
jgi:hypothetical protein